MTKGSINNYELIKLTDNKMVLDDGVYFQIECIKTHKDKHHQRVINKGELGGFVHVDSIQYLQDKWIEKGKAVGKLVTWEGRPTVVVRKKYNSSTYLDFYYIFKKYYSKIRVKAQSNVPSKRNAVLTHVQRALDMIIEVVNFEKKLNHIGANNETQLIVLWTMIGAIQEVILKIHVLIFENEYKSKRPKAQENIWDEKVDTIIRTLIKLDQITHDEMVVLEKINSNRNMIHLLNFGSVFNYEEYLRLVNISCGIYNNLFMQAESKYDKN